MYEYYDISLDNNKKRILVIDDELDICIMLKVVLKQNGFLVNYYSNPVPLYWTLLEPLSVFL